MAVTQIADVIVPVVFSQYITENSLTSTALYLSGVAVENGLMAAGNGSGQTTLFTRFDVALHPLGFSFNGASVAGTSPTMAELALPANWTRTFLQRKSVPLAFLVSK